MPRATRGALLALVLGLTSFSRLAAQDDWNVVAFASDREDFANSVFSFDAGVDRQSAAGTLTRLLATCGSNAGGVVDHVRNNVSAIARQSSARWISAPGDTLMVYVVHPSSKKPKIKVTEDARRSRIAADFETLFALAAKIGGVSAQASASSYSCSSKRYALQRRAANLKIEITLEEAPSASASDAAEGGTDDAAMSASITTGPREIMFLSANIGTSDAREVTYDEASKTLNPPKQPKQFYLGANASFGDLYGDSHDRWKRALGALYLGAFVEGSTKPFRQVGLTLGARFIPYLGEWLALDGISPYAGYVWVQNDSLEMDAPPATGISRVTSKYGKGSFIWGVSVNLSKATGWVGGGDKEEDQ